MPLRSFQTFFKQRMLLHVSLGTAVGLLSVKLFFWELVALLTPFVFPVIEYGVWGVFLSVLVGSFVHGVRQGNHVGRRALVPFGLNLMMLCLALLVPFQQVRIRLNFRRQLEQRMLIINMVEAGVLVSQHRDGISVMLPDQYHALSRNGEIAVEHQEGRLLVFFYTFRGVLDNFSGFMYRSDDTPPQQHDLFGDFKLIQKMQAHWYWVSSD